jgi:hypothetical protein
MTEIVLELLVEDPIELELLVENSIGMKTSSSFAVLSVYDIAVKNGYQGSETDFLNALNSGGLTSSNLALDGGIIF